MYAVVQFGEKEEKVYNLNCKCLHLLYCLRDDGQLKSEVDLDLSDEEGNVKLLHQNLDRYANELLKERERLILLRVNRNEIGDCTYTPLLRNERIVNGSYMARLARIITSGHPRISKARASVSSNAPGQWSAKGSRQLMSPEQSSFRSPKALTFSSGVNNNQPSQKTMKSSSSGQLSRQRSKSKQGP